MGPRGLTGPAYGGHVFWDADVFILPALAAIRPEDLAVVESTVEGPTGDAVVIEPGNLQQGQPVRVTGTQ